MKILITGGSGFIGKNLVEYFSKRHEISAPSHKELELADDDVVKDCFNKNKFDIVIHAAVRPGHRNAKDPSSQLYINSRMFFNIVRNAGCFKKMIFLNSGLVYDQRYYLPKMKEEYFDAHVPVDEAGLSKYIAAKYTEKVNYITELRIFGIFGKYEDYAIRFISNAICKTLLDMPITIKQNRRFDYIYIDDFMPVIEHFINCEPKYKAYNVSPDESIELKTLAEKVKQISGKDIPIMIKNEGMGVEYSGDNSRLKKEIPGLKFTPIDEAIKKLYDWYAEHIEIINKELLLVDK